MEKKTLDGGADDYIQQLLTMNATAMPPPSSGMAPPLDFQPDASFMIDPIQSLQPPPMAPMPAFTPMPPMPGFASMPPMQPMTLPEHPPAPPMPQPIGMSPMPSMSTPWLQGPMPNTSRDMATMQNIFSTPHISAQAMEFPGGSAQHSKIGLSGTMGGGQFSYSSSSTTNQWGGSNMATPLPPGVLAPMAQAQM